MPSKSLVARHATPLLTSSQIMAIRYGALLADSNEPLHCKVCLQCCLQSMIFVFVQVPLDHNHLQHHLHNCAVCPGPLLHGHARASCSLQPAAEVYCGQDGGFPDLLAGEKHFLATLLHNDDYFNICSCI